MKPFHSIPTDVRILASHVTNKSAIIGVAPRGIHFAVSHPPWLWIISFALMGHLCGQESTHGTAIAAIRTNQNIFIAADSRAVDKKGRRLPDACKINQVGLYYVSVHGVGDKDILEMIGNILQGPRNIATKMDQIRDELKGPVTKRMRGQSKKVGPSTGVIVFGLEQGVLHLAYVRFPGPTVKNPNPTPDPVVECPSNCVNGIAMVSASPNDDRLSPSAIGLEDVRSFVLVEIDKSREEARKHKTVADVAGPLQSLTLHQSGMHEWKDRPTFCTQ